MKIFRKTISPQPAQQQNASVLSPLPPERVNELGKEFYHYLYGYMEIIIAENGNPESFFDFLDEQYYVFIGELTDEGLLDHEEEVILNENVEHLKLSLKAIALRHLGDKKKQLLRLARWMEEVE